MADNKKTRESIRALTELQAAPAMEQAAPIINVHVPPQPAPIVTVNVPQQAAPNIVVKMPRIKRTKQTVTRDEKTNLTGAKTEYEYED